MAEVSVTGNLRIIKSAPVGRVYCMSWWFRGFALFFLLIALTALYAFGRKYVDGEDLRSTEVLVAMVLPIVGTGMTLKAFSSRIVFTQQAVEKSWTMQKQSMPLAVIRGRRTFVVNGGDEGGRTRYLRLEANDGRAPLDFGKRLYRFDDAFWEWFNQLPDLDARDKEVHKDSNFGLV